MEENDRFDPETRDAREVAAKAGAEPADFLSLLPHYYRGEVGQMSTRLDRLDLTTDWAIAAVFSPPSSRCRSLRRIARCTSC